MLRMLRHLPWLSLLLPAHASAYTIDSSWSGPVCAFLPCTVMGGGADGLSGYVAEKVVLAMEIGFVAVALIALFLAAMNMVLFGDQEDVVKQSRLQFVYAIAACAVVSLARWLMHAFAPQFVGAQLVDQTIVSSAVGNVITLFRIGLTLLIVVNIVIQGMRLVASQGEQDQFEKARKRLIATFIGAVFVMLANIVAIAALPGPTGATSLAKEFAGFANYLLTIVGFAAVVVIIAAGIMLVVSVSDTLKDKAKTMIKTAVIALVAVMVSFALVTTFITLQI